MLGNRRPALDCQLIVGPQETPANRGHAMGKRHIPGIVVACALAT